MLNRSRSPRRFSGCGDVDRFLEENEIDDNAGNALREASDEIKQSVLEEGAVTGRNKSAILMSRIRRAQSGGGGGSRAPSRSQGGLNDHAAPPAQPKASEEDVATEAMAFCEANGIEASALEELLSHSIEVQTAVMNEGNITGRNPSAVLMSRIRRLEQGGSTSRGVTMPGQFRGHSGWGAQSHSAPPSRRGRSPSPIGRFAAESGIDETALQELREQPYELQRQVIAEGPLTGSRNPSAVLKSRLRRLQEKGAGRGHQGFQGHQGYQGHQDFQGQRRTANEPWATAAWGGAERNDPWGGSRKGGGNGFQDQWDTRRGSSGRGQSASWQREPEHHRGGGCGGAGIMSAREFVDRHDLDEEAKGQFFDLPHDAQARIIDEGLLTGRNQSAVLLSRIRRVGGSGRMPPPPSSGGNHNNRFSPYQNGAPPPNVTQRLNVTLPWENSHRQPARSRDPISQFVQMNRLDDLAERDLRAQTPQVQDAVMQEGAITGRNISAVLASRIKRIVGGSGENQGRSSWGNSSSPPEKAAAAHDFFEPEEDVDPVAKFCSANGIDGSASQALRDAPMEVQLQILEEGNITGRNPNAVLLSRLRRKGH